MKFFKSVYSLKLKYGFEIGLTTNGTLLEDKLLQLKNYGLDKLNVSLDSLKPERFQYITGKNNFNEVIKSVTKALELGFYRLKINVVVIKNVNDDEILDFVEFAKSTGVNVRFIEFMPFGNNKWNNDDFISYKEIKEIIGKKYPLEEIYGVKNLVAKDFLIEGHKEKISFISSISNQFCESCNRLRIDAQGNLKLCLFSIDKDELNFKEILNTPVYSDDDICEMILNSLQLKEKVHPEITELLKLEENNMLSIGG